MKINDPNGKLHKDGGYTSAVYFMHEDVDQEMVSGNTIIEKGTDGGGQIEVYANEEDAISRNNYLANFDGSFLDVGSHTLIGTCIIRVSDKLNASKQKEITENIINELTRID